MRRRLVLVGAAVAGFWATGALALDLPPRGLKVLDRGLPYVDVGPDVRANAGVVRGAVDIAAPLSAVWAVMQDCDLAPRMVANLKSCRILERDPAGRWDVREYVSRRSLLPPIRNVFRSDYQPEQRIAFHRTDGDLAVFEGEWRLEPQAGQVRVTYEAHIAAPFSVPGWIARIALRGDVYAALLAFQRQAVARTP